jgi:hypothetical protein
LGSSNAIELLQATMTLLLRAARFELTEALLPGSHFP